MISQNFLEDVKELLKDIDITHSYAHSCAVVNHIIRASLDLSQRQAMSLVLSGYLHEVDDSKYFDTENYANARDILARHYPQYLDEVIEIISLVSFSCNGNSPADEDWKLITRHADRLEAIGIIGIKRCYHYTMSKRKPIYDEDTPMPQTLIELKDLVTTDRLEAYMRNRGSKTMIDHFYDKLLHVTYTGNTYIDEKLEDKRYLMYQFLLDFSSSKTLPNWVHKSIY